MNNNVVGWFEIPVLDMDRAVTFYETVFGYTLERHPMGLLDMAWFPRTGEGKGSAGALVKHEGWYTPTIDGVLIYFTSPTSDIHNDLEKIESAGGKILVPRKQVSEEYGYMAVFTDTEGNRIALHSRK